MHITSSIATVLAIATAITASPFHQREHALSVSRNAEHSGTSMSSQQQENQHRDLDSSATFAGDQGIHIEIAYKGPTGMKVNDVRVELNKVLHYEGMAMAIAVGGSAEGVDINALVCQAYSDKAGKSPVKAPFTRKSPVKLQEAFRVGSFICKVSSQQQEKKHRDLDTSATFAGDQGINLIIETGLGTDAMYVDLVPVQLNKLFRHYGKAAGITITGSAAGVDMNALVCQAFGFGGETDPVGPQFSVKKPFKETHLYQVYYFFCKV